MDVKESMEIPIMDFLVANLEKAPVCSSGFPRTFKTASLSKKTQTFIPQPYPLNPELDTSPIALQEKGRFCTSQVVGEEAGAAEGAASTALEGGIGNLRSLTGFRV